MFNIDIGSKKIVFWTDDLTKIAILAVYLYHVFTVHNHCQLVSLVNLPLTEFSR